MTTQEKLKIITNDIRQKLPRLMELEEGCLVSVKHNDFISYEAKVIETGGGGQIADTGCYDDSYIFLNSHFEGYEQRHADDEDIEIIGKEPMMTDVLEWLSLVGKDFIYSFSAKGEIYGYSKLMDLSLIVEGTKIDLAKPYLKDQSKEVIDFLYNFIENE